MRQRTGSELSLRLGAALAFHLPGIRVDVVFEDGVGCSVGASFDPTARLHPAELRELLVSPAGMDGVAVTVGSSTPAIESVRVVGKAPWVRYLGGGLYRLAADDGMVYAFVTPLSPDVVDAAMSGSRTAPPETAFMAPGTSPTPGMEESVSVSLVADDALGVTLVLVWLNPGLPSTLEPVVCEIARTLTAACAVAELETATAG